MISEIPVVLTGTISPTVGGATDHGIVERRRQEYLAAIQYYTFYSRAVYFLENSNYDLNSDPSFSRYPNLFIRKMPSSKKPHRGKGYQEFEMLDSWIKTESSPPSKWLKITGRYIITNIDQILNECGNNTQHSLIIDQASISKTSRTYVFFIDSDFYLKHIRGLYRLCDDASGEWIERVLYRKLSNFDDSEIRFFPIKPDLKATMGDSGKFYPNHWFSTKVKRGLRRINEFIDTRYLWFSK